MNDDDAHIIWKFREAFGESLAADLDGEDAARFQDQLISKRVELFIEEATRDDG